MNLQEVNERYMIRKYGSGRETAVFRRPLEEKDKGMFRDVREEDIPVHFAGLQSPVLAETPNGGDGGTPGGEGSLPTADPDKDRKPRGKKPAA